MKLLNPQGILIGRSSHAGEVALKRNGYTVIQLSGGMMFARAPRKSRPYKGRTVILVRTPEQNRQMIRLLTNI